MRQRLQYVISLSNSLGFRRVPERISLLLRYVDFSVFIEHVHDLAHYVQPVLELAPAPGILIAFFCVIHSHEYIRFLLESEQLRVPDIIRQDVHELRCEPDLPAQLLRYEIGLSDRGHELLDLVISLDCFLLALLAFGGGEMQFELFDFIKQFLGLLLMLLLGLCLRQEQLLLELSLLLLCDQRGRNVLIRAQIEAALQLLR